MAVRVSRRSSATVRMSPRGGAPGACSRSRTGAQSFGGSTGTHRRQTTMSESSTLSSKLARNAPARARLPASDTSSRTAFLMAPRTPDTVLSVAPSNFAASSADVNMPSTKAEML